MHRSPQYYDLIDACSQSGCPVCRILQMENTRFIGSLLYEYVNDIPTNRAFRESWGTCALHGTQMMQHKGGALGSAILWEAVLDEVQRFVLPQRSGKGFLAGVLTGQGNAFVSGLPCPVCQHMVEAETQVIAVVCAALDDAAFYGALRGSSGLCLPHLRLALEQVSTRVHAERLLNIQRAIWSALQTEVQSFIRKSDVNYLGEGFGAEGDSWQRAIRALTGEPGVFGLRRP